MSVHTLEKKPPWQLEDEARAEAREAIAELKFHKIANAFPLMTDAELARMGADIKANGLLHPVVIYEGQVLDGRNRCWAAKLVGYENLWWEPYEGDDPIGFVISQNMERRQLTTSQRAAAAASTRQFARGSSR